MELFCLVETQQKRVQRFLFWRTFPCCRSARRRTCPGCGIFSFFFRWVPLYFVFFSLDIARYGTPIPEPMVGPFSHFFSSFSFPRPRGKEYIYIYIYIYKRNDEKKRTVGLVFVSRNRRVLLPRPIFSSLIFRFYLNEKKTEYLACFCCRTITTEWLLFFFW